MNRINRLLVSGAVALTAVYLAFVGVAVASGTVSPESTPLLDLMRPVYEAFTSGQWWLGASLGLVFAVTAFKRYAPAKWGLRAFANSDVGGAVVLLVGAFGAALAAGLTTVGTGAMTLGLAWAAFKVALGAAGGYSLAKKLIVPFVTSLSLKAPLWMQPGFALVLWAFAKPDPVVVAEAAGAAAVEAKPATGADGVVPPTDL